MSHGMSHPHGASFENIDQQGPPSVEFITTDTNPHMALVIKSETSRHVAQENQNQTHKCETCKSKCSLFISFMHAVTQTK